MKRLRFKTLIFVGKSIFKAKVFKKGIPLFVSWAITNRCNARCRYCEIWNNNSYELSTEQCFLLIDELGRLGTKRISFTGGEPLLREDIGLVVDYAFQKGISTAINSNGLLVPERISELKNLTAIKLSLDGPPQVHDFIRGKGSFDKVIKAIEIAKERNVKVFLCTVLSKYSLGHIDYILNTAKTFNVAVSFQPATKTLLGNDEVNPISSPPKEYKQVISKLINKKMKSEIGKYIYNSVTGLKHIYNWPTPKNVQCGGGLIFCRIEPNGDLLLCARSKDKKKFNCTDLGLQEAFNKLLPYSCGSCWCVGVVEANYLLSYNLNVIINLLKVET